MSVRISLLLLASAGILLAIDSDRDFSGKWIISTGARLSVPFEDTLSIDQTDTEIRCSSGGAMWTYALNGTERKAQTGAEKRNSLVKWEGAALLINTIVSGPQDYTIMDRWRLSRDHATLVVTRQIVRGVRQEEGSMTYRRDRPAAPPPPPPVPTEEAVEPPPAPRPAPAPIPRSAPPAGPARPSAPTLARREEAEPFEIVIAAGTHIPLAFRNTVDTRHANEGQHIYLQTAFPVAQEGRVVIPRGSFVNGTITGIKHGGHSAKGELFIRFDTLSLPNGVLRDLRSRPAGDDEGKIAGQSGADAGSVAQATGRGATVGVMTGAATGHAGMGAGIGGAAAGIASVLLSKGGDASLPQGTTVDMVLDRNLRFRSDELR